MHTGGPAGQMKGLRGDTHGGPVRSGEFPMTRRGTFHILLTNETQRTKPAFPTVRVGNTGFLADSAGHGHAGLILGSGAPRSLR